MALGLFDRFRSRRDPVQQLAVKHMYSNLEQLSTRRELFREASPEVQRQVLAELDAVADHRKPGARGPAILGLVAVVSTSMTLMATFFIALISDAIITTPPDPKTGQWNNKIGPKLFAVLNSGEQLIFLLCGVALLVALVVWGVAVVQDGERVRARSWARIFRGVLEEGSPDVADVADGSDSDDAASSQDEALTPGESGGDLVVVEVLGKGQAD